MPRKKTVEKTPELETSKHQKWLLLILTIIFFLLIVAIGSELYIFIRLFFNSASLEIRILSLVLGFLAATGIADQILRFIVLHSYPPHLRTLVYDLITGGIGIGFLLALMIFSLFNKPRIQDKERL